MHAVDQLELVLSRVQFIAEIALIAKCKQSELHLALTLISELASVYSKTHENHDSLIKNFLEVS
ncbi:hypothetical protein [Sodalis ligni]|uniref:Uncharacterized protein n=1 Tax=Sodalis ligni TaxID=2697027 RepID=A0A4R1NG84_9GAMM|nr:hypothetical protein [Sodalis ligni]TCL03696.1 hypothetical protein EZJ58_1773 [Sodalis ligni]